MKLRTLVLLLSLPSVVGVLSGCSTRNLATAPMGGGHDRSASGAVGSIAADPEQGSENGAAGEMPAYYDHNLLTINFFELPAGGENANLLRNASINTIYMSDAGLPGDKPFISVLDAIQGDGFNPLWVEVQITFTPGHTPRQLFSDDEVASAVASGEITRSDTGELYRCSVVGPKQ